MGAAFDLHVHTTASDGELSPSETVRRAAAARLLCVAVTDHDTTEGVAEAQAEGLKLGLPVIAGAEFSAEADTELHILGYGMDTGSPAYLAFVGEQQQRRRDRNVRMLERLSRLGVTLPEEYTPDGVPGEYGRRHMALGMEKAGIVRDERQAFDEYLSAGARAYVPRRKFSAHELIGAIRASGGRAVLAHPGRTGLDAAALDTLAGSLARSGLAGIEAFYPLHSDGETKAYLRIARRHGLVCTYGSDWHGYRRDGLAMGFHAHPIPDETYEWLDGLIRPGGIR